MPLSSSNVSVLQRIAELAGSDEPVENRLKQILAIARESLGLDALSAVADNYASSELKAWHSISDCCSPDLKSIEKTARDAITAGTSPIIANDHFVITAPPVDGYRVVIVGLGEVIESELTLVQVISGYLSILIDNYRLNTALDSSNRTARVRMEEIATIYEIGQSIDPNNLHLLLDTIVEKAASVMDAQTCSLMLRSPQDGTLVIEASHGLSKDIVKGARINIGEGIAGRVAETGQPMLLLDVGSDPRFNGTIKQREDVSGSICVPLKDENGSVMGVLSIRRHKPKQPFDADDLKLFGVLATHAALAISNANLYSGLHQKVQEMSTISDVLKAINSTLDLEHVLNQIVDSITSVVEFDRCCVYLLDSRTNEFIAHARKGFESTDQIRSRIKYNDGVIGLAAKERIPIFSQGSPVETEGSNRSGEFLVAPIVVRDECIGVVVVDNCVLNRPIEPHHVDLLATFVSQAGIAVENARLYEAMEEKYAELNILYEQSKSISAATGLDGAADMLVQTASRAVRCDGAAVLLFDTKRGRLKLQATSGGLTRLASDIEQLAREEHCVKFIRDQRHPMLIQSDSPERTMDINADLLNALAPNGANLMLAPLVTEDTTIGVLALSRKRSEIFQAAEFKLISIVASHAATVLKNAIAYDQKMRQRVLELTAIYEFSKRISSAANLEQALDSILAIVADLVDYDELFIYAIDRDHGIAAVKAARFRGRQHKIPQEEALDGNSVTSWAIKEHKALISPDISHDPRFGDFSVGGRSVRSLMSIPLIVQDDVVGVLSIHSYSPNQYSEDDVRVLSIIASQGAAIYKELEALTALTSYTDNILSSIAAGVVTLSSDGVMLTWNMAAEHIIGLRAGSIEGKTYEQILSLLKIAEADKESLRKAIHSVLDTGVTYQGYKLCFHPEKNDEIYMNMSISQLLNSAGEQLGLVLIFEDVTREIKMENEFRRMGELAAIGQLAASIAHELRNPLSSIKGAAQFLQKEYEDHGAIVEFLGIIVDEVNGLNKLTTEFLDFARPMQFELKTTSVNTVVDKTLQLMSVHITDNNVVVKENLDKTVPCIRADERQLQQVLKNIIINALQAMPEGGVLTIETGRALAGGAYFSVTDTGIGIPKEKIDRIFQPFVTTKTKGTGLGLSVVQKIIENHGGRIEVASEVGKGTTFKVLLPHNGATTTIPREIDQTMERRISGELK